MRTIDLYRQVLHALELEPNVRGVAWNTPQATIRSNARVALKQAIREEDAKIVTLQHRGGSTWFCPSCEVYVQAACPCCEPPACSRCGARAKVPNGSAALSVVPRG